MKELDMNELRALAIKFGFWPATTRPEDIERHRVQAAELLAWESRAAAKSLTKEQLERRYGK